MINPSFQSDTERILLRWARWLALVFMFTCVGILVLLLPGYFRNALKHPVLFTPYNWSVEDATDIFMRTGLSFQTWIYLQLISALVTSACYCIVGGLIYARKQKDWFGLFVSIVLVLYGTLSIYNQSIFSSVYSWFDAVIQALSVFSWALWFLIFYLFPDGHFFPRWTRWFALLLMFGFVLDVVFYSGGTPPAWLAAVLLPGLVVGPFSVIYRYRRISTPLQRQQTKWVFFAILVLIISLILGLLTVVFPGLVDVKSPGVLTFVYLSLFSSLLITIFPLSIGFAILRYRLWDIDVIIRRTLVYSILTVALALVFFGGVTILQSLFTALTGQESAVSVVLSTLAIAASFNPLRKRIQNFIDRRFYRQKYNAEQALRRFALKAQSETDIEQLSAELVAVVAETMQPDCVNLWLKPARGK
jgi:hypothetical protein